MMATKPPAAAGDTVGFSRVPESPVPRTIAAITVATMTNTPMMIPSRM